MFRHHPRAPAPLLHKPSAFFTYPEMHDSADMKETQPDRSRNTGDWLRGLQQNGRASRIMLYVNTGILVVLAAYFVLAPEGITISDLSDPRIRKPGIPGSAIRLFYDLTPKYAAWARQRLNSSRAAALSTRDISGTEWPLFGSVFYLWAVESLQEAWEQDPSLMDVEPKKYAREAVEAATRLVTDPVQASWVREHWGEDYMRRENVFYRMLFIAALTSHARLTGSEKHLDVLREQVEDLSAELEKSPHGLLDDYPGQCYPADVLVAVACIRRADRVLGTDHSAFAERAIRAFRGGRLDERGLVPYAAYADIGQPVGPSRGCSNSYVSLFAPELWPEQAREWYRLYEKHFWQERWGAVGFREFPADMEDRDWYMGIDSGPVVMGFGFAASAFGTGAARVNGRFDHAYPLTAEMLVASWPLPDGTLWVPRLLSNSTDAPYLGEAAILYCLTRMPAEGVEVRKGGTIPPAVYLALSLGGGAGLLLIAMSVLRARRFRRREENRMVPLPRLQGGLWLALLVGGAACLFASRPDIAILLVLAAQLLPRFRPVDNEEDG